MPGAQIIITPSGEELVVLPRTIFDKFVARVGTAEAATLIDADARSDSGTAMLADEPRRAIASGVNPVRALRKWRGMTQVILSNLAGISQGYLSEIENGHKTGDADTLKRLSRALGVPLDVLVP